MQVMFIHRNSTKNETMRIQLAMSTFCDGSGQLMEPDGATRPGWRDFERIFAELLGGIAPENKEIFDVVVRTDNGKDYGFSLKSKELYKVDSASGLAPNSRVYMELSNSPAKFWAALMTKNITEDDFRNKRQPEVIGNTILEVVKVWHNEAAEKYVLSNPGRQMDLENSVYLVVSYSKGGGSLPRTYQVHSFSLDFPKNIVWKFISAKCLRGYDPEFPEEALVDWYALSGGQLKYYPRASTAKHKTEPFQLIPPKKVSIMEKAKIYFPKQWAMAEVAK